MVRILIEEKHTSRIILRNLICFICNKIMIDLINVDNKVKGQSNQSIEFGNSIF